MDSHHDNDYHDLGLSADLAMWLRSSLESDNVFSDGATEQIATVTGNTTDGYLATLVVGVAV